MVRLWQAPLDLVAATVNARRIGTGKQGVGSGGCQTLHHLYTFFHCLPSRGFCRTDSSECSIFDLVRRSSRFFIIVILCSLSLFCSSLVVVELFSSHFLFNKRYLHIAMTDIDRTIPNHSEPGELRGISRPVQTFASIEITYSDGRQTR